MSDKSRMDLPEGSVVRSLNPFREKQIARHLNDKAGYELDAAKREASRLFRLSDGAPSRIVYDMLERVTASVEPRL